MKKILVINFRYFGDALISASLSVRIRELWPDAHITYLVFDSVEGVLEGIETIDEILTVPERPDKWEQFRWMAAHWNDYDLAFVTQTGTRPGLYGFFMVHLGSPWNAALTFKKKSGRLPPRKIVALTPNFRQIQITSEEPRKKDEHYDQYCRATVQISRSMARLPDHFLQDSSLARRWQEDSNS